MRDRALRRLGSRAGPAPGASHRAGLRADLRDGGRRTEQAALGARISRHARLTAGRGPWPMTVDIDATKSARLRAKKPGYKDLEVALTFNENETERTFRIELEPASAVAYGGRAPSRSRAPERERPAPVEREAPDKS